MSICCLNPYCLSPINPDGTNFCQKCGTKILTLLQGKYRITDFLGQGGFARTYLAQMRNQKKCVVKQLIANAQGTRAINKVRELFKGEAEQLRLLGTHPQIPTFYDYFQENQQLYLIQEFVEGKNLLENLKFAGVWQEGQIQDLLKSLLPVLEFIHQKGVIHRDLKPDNIMRRLSDGNLVLIDFGVSKTLSGAVKSRMATRVGTSGYGSPKQKRGIPSPSSDLYSLGATCFHLLTGKHPDDLMQDEGYDWTKNWREYLKSPLKMDLDQVIDKLLKTEINERYQSADQVLQDLLKVVPTPIATPTLHPGRRDTLYFIGIATASLIAAVATKDIWDPPDPTPVRNPVPRPSPTPRLQTFSFTVITVDRYGKEINRTPGNAQYFTENLSGVTLDMVFIKGNTFIMGSPDSELERSSSEGPQHRVTVPDFYMGKYAVTQAQYRAIMGNNPANFKGDNRPVEQVSWYEAVAFCEKLSALTNKNYRLPSEAEWEYACRGGTKTPFHFGENITPELVNYNGNYPYAKAPKGQYRIQTTAVGLFPPNAFGLYDMHGNVWEWCEDVYQDNYNGAPTDGTNWLENQQNDIARLLRGGSWSSSARNCRSAIRSKLSPESRFLNFGFRVVVRQ